MRWILAVSSDPERPDNQRSSSSSDRLQREVEDILRQAERRPVSFQDAVRRRASQKRQAARSAPITRNMSQLTTWRPGPGSYLIGVIVFAIVAAWSVDRSPLLATIAGALCLASLIVPIALHVRRPMSPVTKTWRGRDMTFGARSRGGIDQLRDRFRRPPRI